MLGRFLMIDMTVSVTLGRHIVQARVAAPHPFGPTVLRSLLGRKVDSNPRDHPLGCLLCADSRRSCAP